MRMMNNLTREAQEPRELVRLGGGITQQLERDRPKNLKVNRNDNDHTVRVNMRVQDPLPYGVPIAGTPTGAALVTGEQFV